MGELFALFTAFLWSGSSIAFTEASKRIGSVQLNVNRMFIAALYLSLTILFFNLSTQVSFEQFGYLFISGFIGLVFGDSFLFKAYQLIGARLSMLLMSLVPAISGLLAFLFLDESLSTIDLIAISVTIFGISIALVEREPSISAKSKINLIGILFGFLAAVGQAAGLIFAKSAFAVGELNAFLASLIRLLTAAIILLGIAIIIKKYKNPIKIYRADKKALTFTSIGAFLGPYLGITMSLLAVANAKVGIASTIMATVPVVMLPMVRIIYKNKLSVKAILGAVLAVMGVAILFLN